MLRDLPRMRAVIEAMKQAVTVPVTVKTRLGWDANSIVADQVAVLCQSLGVAALALHARTRSQFFSGEADYSCARTIKACAALPLWLNGGLQDVKHISKIVKESGADGVLIGQAALGRPWIFKEIKHFFQPRQRLHLPFNEIYHTIQTHLQSLYSFYGSDFRHAHGAQAPYSLWGLFINARKCPQRR